MFQLNLATIMQHVSPYLSYALPERVCTKQKKNASPNHFPWPLVEALILHCSPHKAALVNLGSAGLGLQIGDPLFSIELHKYSLLHAHTAWQQLVAARTYGTRVGVCSFFPREEGNGGKAHLRG